MENVDWIRHSRYITGVVCITLQIKDWEVEKRIARMYISDTVIIILSITATWIVLAFVLHEVLPLAGNTNIRLIIEISAVAVAVCATGAFIALLGHLRRNRATLYREDLAHRRDGQSEEISA
jgi:hypothetical protein